MGGPSNSEPRQKLHSWKEIAVFLGKDVRTARRWNLERGLPVHRVPGGKGGSVFAYVDELQAWLDKSPSEQQPLRILQTPPVPSSSEFSFGDGVAEHNSNAPKRLQSPKPASAQPFIRGSILILVAAVLLTGSYFSGKILFPPSSPAQRLKPASFSTGHRIMLAVLPFTNLSGDAGQEYFSDGLTEELITQLARLDPERLGIIARTSVMFYKTAPKPAQQVAQDLGVEYLLEGSVVRQQNQAHVRAALIRASDQSRIWSGSYDRTTQDIYALEGQLTREIAAEIRVSLGSSTEKELASVPTLNPEAHEAYLQGRYYWNQRSPEGLTKSVGFYERAIKADPHFALAYAGLAETYSVMSGYGVMSPGECYPKARAAALKALQLDDSAAEAHAALASILSDHDHNWLGAEHEFRRALDLNPGYATTHQWRSENLSWMGRHGEAINEIERARQLDPLSPSINASWGSALYMARRYDDSIEVLRKTVEMYPDFAYAHSRLGYSYLAAGKISEAKGEFETALRLSSRNANYLTGLGRALAMESRLGEARKVAGQMEAASRGSYVSPFAVALVYASVGDKNRALDFLEKADQEKDDNINALNVEPALDTLRNEPRFQTLARRLTSPQGPY